MICYLRIKNQKTGKICFTFGQPNTVPKEKPERPDNEPDTPDIPKQEVKAEVKVTNTLPPANPVKAYVANELTFMKQMFEIPDTKEMMAKFAEMRKALIAKGIIPDIKADDQTMEQAQQMIDAIYNNFTPKGEMKDARTA